MSCTTYIPFPKYRQSYKPRLRTLANNVELLTGLLPLTVTSTPWEFVSRILVDLIPTHDQYLLHQPASTGPLVSWLTNCLWLDQRYPIYPEFVTKYLGTMIRPDGMHKSMRYESRSATETNTSRGSWRFLILYFPAHVFAQELCSNSPPAPCQWRQNLTLLRVGDSSRWALSYYPTVFYVVAQLTEWFPSIFRVACVRHPPRIPWSHRQLNISPTAEVKQSH